jgi:polygalacturonase
MMNKPALLSCLAALSFFLPSLASSDVPPSTFFNVRNYGAVGDGKTLDSPAINKAIEAAAAVGGGTVDLPAGTYLSGSIRLKSNIHLVIEAGAVLLGAPQSMKAYDVEEAWSGVRAYQDGGHSFFHNSLIWGENLTNVFITGTGIINGGGLVSGDGNENLADNMFGAGRGRGNIPVTAITNADGSITPNERLGNKAIALKLCRNILIRDITIFHGGHFAILVTGCDNITVDNVIMDTNRDGIDIDCCRNTMVSNCRINSPIDDALCPKSSFALGRNVITENLVIVNCQVSGFKEGTLLDGTMLPGEGNGRIKLGTEANGGFRNVTIANCTFCGCMGLALEEVDGGIMENITVNNITMMDVKRSAIYITTGKRNRGPDVKVPSRAKNILISNIIADGIDKNGIEIYGTPEQPVENVRLENIIVNVKGGGTAQDANRLPRELATAYPEPVNTMLPSYGVYARHVKGLELANITVGFDGEDQRPALAVDDVDGLEIEHFKAKLSANVVPAKLNNVKNLVVLNSPVLQGVEVAKP